MNYKIGTKFLSGGKAKKINTVVDIHTTLNLAGEIVNVRYVATHVFCGQIVEERDICAVTIARGLTGTFSEEVTA